MPRFSDFDARGYRTVDVRTGYGEWVASYEETVHDAMDIALLDALGSVPWRSVKDAADLGCGTGRTGAWLRQQGVTVIDGVDLTPEMLAVARSTGVYRQVIEADVTSTGLASGAYDLVTVCLVDEHLAELQPLYREAWRLVQPAAFLVLVGYHPQFIMAPLTARAPARIVHVRPLCGQLSVARARRPGPAGPPPDTRRPGRQQKEEAMTTATPTAQDQAQVQAGRPVVLRNGAVLTMDEGHHVLHQADVLVVGERIAGVGPKLEVPDSTTEIDARGGIVMPGMIDSHRHMWQTAMRGYGADWTLTQYFVWYYLQWGKVFRPQDIYAGNLLSAIEALDAGVTTTVDWSHGLQTTEHADAAVDALEAVPGRFLLAYGNIQQGPWEWSTTPAFRDFVVRRMQGRGDMLGFLMAFDVPDSPDFPERVAFEVARELDVPVTTHAGVRGATSDVGIRAMYDHGFMTPRTIYVHAATLSDDSYQRIAATGGSVSVATESEQSAGQGYPPTWRLRQHGIPVSLSMDTSVWWSGDLFSAMRTTLSADRSREHLEAHNRDETVTHHHLRAERVVAWATRGGSQALGLDSVVGSLEVGKKADVVLIKNDGSPAMFPLLNPYGHVVFQAQRGDVDTVIVNGQVVKFAHKLVGIDLDRARQAVEQTVDYLRGQLGDEAWVEGMHPEIPEQRVLENPYTYTYTYADQPTGVTPG